MSGGLCRVAPPIWCCSIPTCPGGSTPSAFVRNRRTRRSTAARCRATPCRRSSTAARSSSGRGKGMTGIVLAAVIGYLLGSIPFGMVLTRVAGLGDIRRIGSGNIGATNVLRTGNKALAALTVALDLAKGVAAVLIGSLWGGDAMLAAAGAVILGHMFPVWLGFRGGKGVATALGVWLAIAIVFHYSSLAALVGAVAAVVLAAVMVEPARALLIAGIALLVVLRHHENIRRLLAGTEGRISFGKG